jgi:hypothetical protein
MIGSPPVTRRSPWWVEAAVVVWLCWIYDAVANLSPIRQGAAVAHALDVLHFERAVHLDPEAAMDHWLAGHPSLGWVVGTYYNNMHFVATFAVVAVLWWFRPDLYRPLRTALALLNVVGIMVFWWFPMAPPRLLPGGGFVDVVAATGSPGSWHTGQLARHADQLAAMPSLHMAWAMWTAWAAWRMLRGRKWAALVWAYPITTAVVVLATGNHFLADVLAGVCLTAVVVPLSDRLPSPGQMLRSVIHRRNASGSPGDDLSAGELVDAL